MKLEVISSPTTDDEISFLSSIFDGVDNRPHLENWDYCVIADIEHRESVLTIYEFIFQGWDFEIVETDTKLFILKTY